MNNIEQGNLNNYKPIKVLKNGKYVINWGLTNVIGELYSWYFHVFDNKPSIELIKETIESDINKRVKKLIESKFIWNGMNIPLSIEKQFDYKLLLDTTLLLDGTNLPETVKFKINNENIYYTFETVDDLKDFVIAINNHIRKCLKISNDTKDAVDYNAFKQ